MLKNGRPFIQSEQFFSQFLESIVSSRKKVVIVLPIYTDWVKPGCSGTGRLIVTV